MDRQYDLVLSLGANCSAAGNMGRRGLRRCSLPFDWLYIVDDRPLYWLAEHLHDRLHDFCLKKNLVQITPDNPEWFATSDTKFKYIDSESGYRFIHLFHKSIESSDEYERVYPVLRRRIDRMYELLGRSEKVLLLLATGKTLGDEALLTVKAAFERQYPGVRFDIEFLKFDDAMYNEIKSVERQPGDGIHIVEIPRAINEYDFSLTNFEWSFLDGVSMTSKAIRPGFVDTFKMHVKRIIRWLRSVRNRRMV